MNYGPVLSGEHLTQGELRAFGREGRTFRVWTKTSEQIFIKNWRSLLWWRLEWFNDRVVLTFSFWQIWRRIAKKKQLLSYTAIFENMQPTKMTSPNIASPNIAFETTAFNEWPPVLNGQLWSKTQVWDFSFSNSVGVIIVSIGPISIPRNIKKWQLWPTSVNFVNPWIMESVVMQSFSSLHCY